ncbi:TetR family transcriptional regulator [Bacillus sp. FJAT-49736]|uniref:TetR family transcriptional regulator n=1 Tax=Bacillus sp. FJAT-49736 TaxID=2833582 RepID=UPI001BC9821D|nr:TetR family transcriptional regulator [Bacillus sp. FJAT-49736]MBS4172224.1 TetR family transcriptional regulator [Bacillus sp. FJAT-49736]
MSPKVSAEYKEKKRLQILHSATEVFCKKGFEPTTMKDIKEAASISFGSLYFYFSSTEEIFLGILELSHSRRDFQEKIAFSTAWEKIEYFLDSQTENSENIDSSIVPVAYEYFMTSWREKKRLAILENRYEQATKELLSLIQNGITTGEFLPIISAEVIAKTIISTLEGLNISSLFLKKDLVEARNQINTLKLIIKHLLQIQEE